MKLDPLKKEYKKLYFYLSELQNKIVIKKDI